MLTEYKNLYNTKVTTAEFKKLSAYINRQYGIKLPPEKRVMLQSRLHKRLRDLNMASFDQYINYLFSKEGNQLEEIHMMNVVSTNKTEFFRESSHFDFLCNHILTDLISDYGSSDTLKVWSAGCSSGEEAYTIAMVLEEYMKTFRRFNYQIHGTDISTKVLAEAVDAVYEGSKTIKIPLELKRRYFLKSIKQGSELLRVAPELRKNISFSRLNFMDNQYEINAKYDIVFCRNVLIYFDREVQEAVINKICRHIKPGGYLFLGHSESITKMNVPLIQIRPTVFQVN